MRIKSQRIFIYDDYKNVWRCPNCDCNNRLIVKDFVTIAIRHCRGCNNEYDIEVPKPEETMIIASCKRIIWKKEKEIEKLEKEIVKLKDDREKRKKAMFATMYGQVGTRTENQNRIFAQIYGTKVEQYARAKTRIKQSGAKKTMSYEQHLNRLIGEGFFVEIGEHIDDLLGYFANVKIDDDDQVNPWNNCGHGFTIEEALENAELIAKGCEFVRKYTSEDFIKDKEEGMVVWVKGEAVSMPCDQRAVVIEVLKTDHHTAILHVRLLGISEYYDIAPCDIVGVDFDGGLTIKFKYNGYTLRG